MLGRVPWSTVGKDTRAVCQAVDRFPREALKRQESNRFGSFELVEKLWKKGLDGWICSTFKSSDQSLRARAALAIRTGLRNGLSRSTRRSWCLCLSRDLRALELSFAGSAKCSSRRPAHFLLPRTRPKLARKQIDELRTKVDLIHNKYVAQKWEEEAELNKEVNTKLHQAMLEAGASDAPVKMMTEAEWHLAHGRRFDGSKRRGPSPKRRKQYWTCRLVKKVQPTNLANLSTLIRWNRS